jgi:hypothetical protein
VLANMKEKIINILIFIPAVLLPTALLYIVAIGFEFVGVQKPFELAYWIFLLLTSPIWIMIAYKFLKDIHQSNLDDIEQQQLEEPVDEVVVKEQVSNSVAAFWFLLFLVFCCVSFLISQESIGVIDWLIALSIIAAPLILAYFVGEWFVDKDDTEEQELQEQKLS